MTATRSPAAIYAHGLADGYLHHQRCDACSRAIFPPRVLCPHCHTAKLKWVVSRGLGTVYTGTIVWSRKGDNPVALIDLDEGFRMMCRLTTSEATVPGTRVIAVVPPGSTVDSLTFTRADAS